MARKRLYFDDIAYSEEHRKKLPELYRRFGHRLDMADRDWTEFCHHCKEPLALIEQVRDLGQNLMDKGVTVTRKLAEKSGIPAYLMAWRVERPPEIQAEIERLGKEIMKLQTAYPIVDFRVANITHRPRIDFGRLSPAQWWTEVALWHRDHHSACVDAQRALEAPVNTERLEKAKTRSPIWPREDLLL